MGEELNRRRMPIPMTPMATARALTRSVWPVVARINGEFEPHGTGFLISHSGLVMTARHVVEPPAQKRSRSLGPDGWFDEGDLFVLIVSRPNSHGGQALPAIVRIERINFMTRGDIAICHAARANGSRPSDIDALILHPGLPKKGEKVWTFGYKELDPSVRVETIEELEVHTNPEGLLTAGVVEEVHIPRKPNSFTDFPCFTISAEIFRRDERITRVQFGGPCTWRHLSESRLGEDGHRRARRLLACDDVAFSSGSQSSSEKATSTRFN
jgi:hypothetical protein